ncbi:hypothetical protein RF11_13577 [Thelohanellus kitauei]|uniref:Uncharacterized protein n=1 Tax=Thelohanellus kitauei TaxID=669202 RepID=A0A0C2JUG7_THEKT|nr:hypothetical protein RF11_13577 [Thelohanellus kitauei]
MRHFILLLLQASLVIPVRRPRKTVSSYNERRDDQDRTNPKPAKMVILKPEPSRKNQPLRKNQPFCSYVGIPFPHGCIDVTAYAEKLTFQTIFFEGKETKILFDKKSMNIPRGLLMSQLYIKDSSYYLCGLDFITKNITLNLNFKMNALKTKKDVEFCYRFYKGNKNW